MSSALPKDQVDQLKGFVTLLKARPEVLHDPALAFFREYLESMGAAIPAATSRPKEPEPKPTAASAEKPAGDDDLDVPEAEQDNDSDDSDVDLDMTGVIEPDNDEPQDMGSSSVDGQQELSEEALDTFETKRGEAMAAMGDGDWQKAIDLFTEAIRVNSGSAVMFAKRGACYLKIKKPNACIRDCNRAIELNPDNAGAHKFRGRAHRLLGNFALAAQDLRLACKIDFDEVADEWLREVTPNAKKIEEHERKKQRKLEEKDLREKKERIRKAQEAREKAAKEGPAASSRGPFGGGGMPHGLGDLLNDPDLVAAFSDPEVAAAFQDISLNPANLAKYEKNPKVMALLTKMMSTFGGPGDAEGLGPSAGEGGMPNLFPGFGGGAKPPGPAGGPPPPPTPSTDDLD